jgi:hypothetical protein
MDMVVEMKTKIDLPKWLVVYLIVSTAIAEVFIIANAINNLFIKG